MKTINLCLLINEPEYSTALSISLLTNYKYFSIETDNNLPFDILLTDDMKLTEERAVFLTEDPTNERVDEEGKIFVLYKYQHIGRISNILRLAYSVFANDEIMTEEIEKTNIVSICSSDGGVGCTSVALGISQELARFHGKQVLYLNLEEFESTAFYFPDANGGSNNISRFIYTLLYSQNGENRSPIGYLVKDGYGISTFRPAKGRNPLRDLNDNEFVKFMKQILKENVYTDLIVDCGNGVDESIISALSLSGHVFYVMGKSTNSDRMKAYLRTVSNRGEALDKSIWSHVYNFYWEQEKPENINQNDYETVIYKIRDAESSFERMNGQINISIDKDFGQGVRQIVEQFSTILD